MSLMSVTEKRRTLQRAKTQARKRAAAYEEYEVEDNYGSDVQDVLSGLDGYSEFMSDRNSGYY